MMTRSLLLVVSALAFAPSIRAADDLVVLKPNAGSPAPRRMLYSSLLAECDRHFATRLAAVEKLKTPADVAARRNSIRERFVAALGGFPEKRPLNASSVGTLRRNGYVVEKVIYESRPEHHVTANLYLPAGPGRFPGVLMPVGHSLNGKAAEYMQRAAVLLARNGIAALVYDPIGQGERNQLLDSLGKPAIKGSTSEHTMCGVGALLVGQSTASYRIWDGIRSLDYLASRPEIDPARLGCTGCSGGGTLTSYLMALDDRIVAAAPSCYLTTLGRLFATLGPQDAEQNITGQVAFGMDHADYIVLHAPRPTLVLASTRDFFDIAGTWISFREAKRIYTLLGHPERLDILEADDKHGYPRSHRVAMARFMSRWLLGRDRDIAEDDFPIENDDTLRCTRTGQVLDDLKGKSVFDLNARRAADYAKARGQRTGGGEAFRGAVTQALRLPDKIVPPVASEAGEVRRDGYRMALQSFSSGAVPLPALHVAREGLDGNEPLVVSVRDEGKAIGGAVEQFVKSGKRVLSVDLRGFGETAPAPVAAGKGPAFGVEQKEAFVSLHLDRPLLGQRTADLLGLIGKFEDKRGIGLHGSGSAGLAALHAAMLDPRVNSLTLDGCLVSWENVVRTPISHNQLASVVPDVLKTYDLPDLAAALAPRPLTIRNPVDAAGNRLTRDAAERGYRSVREAYRKADAAASFSLIVESR